MVSNTTPTPLCVLCAVSTLITKAYITASCHGVVRRFVRHRWRVINPRFSFFWFLSLVLSFIVTSCFPSRVLMTPSLVIVTCFAMSLTLRSAAIARLVLDASFLQCTRERPTLFNCAVQSFCWMRNSVSSFLFACCRARSSC